MQQTADALWQVTQRADGAGARLLDYRGQGTLRALMCTTQMPEDK